MKNFLTLIAIVVCIISIWEGQFIPSVIMGLLTILNYKYT